MQGLDSAEFLTTGEVAELLRVKTRKVYDLAANSDIPCRRVTGKLLFPKEALLAWLANGERSTDQHVSPPDVIAGSHDPLLDWAIREARAGLSTAFDGSRDGLEQMASGQALAAGIHLYDPVSEDWNIPQVRETLDGRRMVLVTWARRQQGLVLGRSVPVKRIEDLKGRRIVKRQAGAGAGILFNHLLRQSGLTASDIVYCETLARTETEAVAAVSSGDADATPGLLAVARQFDLPFLPLTNERFDLLVDRAHWFEPPFQRLLAFCRTAAFAAKAEAFGGYDISELGAVRWNGPH